MIKRINYLILWLRLDAIPGISYHSIVWNASSFPSGLYFIRLESAGRIEIAKVALIR
ncbi:MAG: hypothetical protein HQ568_09155 [Calditrichaeota bacterium]|nr:hypothetical protein [Calditrichota bacterium]